VVRDADCYVLRQSDFTKGSWSKGCEGWASQVTLVHALDATDAEPVLQELRILIAREGMAMAVKHVELRMVQQFKLAPAHLGTFWQCPKCRRGVRTLWMPARQSPATTGFYCRTCWHVEYTSARQDSNRYHVDAGRLAAQRLENAIDSEVPALADKRVRHLNAVADVRNIMFMGRIGRGSFGRRYLLGDMPELAWALQRLRE
jgi:hypothetical protein